MKVVLVASSHDDYMISEGSHVPKRWGCIPTWALAITPGATGRGPWRWSGVVGLTSIGVVGGHDGVG